MLPWPSSLPVCSRSTSPIAVPLPGMLCPQARVFLVPSLLSGRYPIVTLSASLSLTLHLKQHLPLPISLLCLILLPVMYLFSQHLALGHIHLLVGFMSVSPHRGQVPPQDQKRLSYGVRGLQTFVESVCFFLSMNCPPMLFPSFLSLIL